VKFALYSDGQDTPRDFQRAVKKAIDNGLSRDEALRALDAVAGRNLRHRRPRGQH